MYVGFPIPQPPEGLYAIEAATLSGAQGSAQGDPYSLSSLDVDQIMYEAPPTAAENTEPAIRSLGVFATSASTALPSISALPTMQDAFASAGHQVLFRFRFGALPSANSLANFYCTGWQIAWTYLTA